MRGVLPGFHSLVGGSRVDAYRGTMLVAMVDRETSSQATQPSAGRRCDASVIQTLLARGPSLRDRTHQIPTGFCHWLITIFPLSVASVGPVTPSGQWRPPVVATLHHVTLVPPRNTSSSQHAAVDGQPILPMAPPERRPAHNGTTSAEASPLGM